MRERVRSDDLCDYSNLQCGISTIYFFMTAYIDPVFRIQSPSGPAFLKYLRTLRYLKWSQAGYLLRNRLLPPFFAKKVPADLCRRESVQCMPFARPVSPSVGETEIEFLNHRRRIDLDSMDWRCTDESRLWRYNLHYFDYLHWESYSPAAKNALVGDWIVAESFGGMDAWEPYPVSLRAVNWIKYFLRGGEGVVVSERWERSLAEQMLWLEANFEYHLLANHLLKNAKALIFSGVFFAGDMGRRHLGKGMQIMVAEVIEQISPDGGHFERSPMYHCIVLEDVLDVVNLLKANPDLVRTEDLAVLEHAASLGLQFLEDILYSDGYIPLFNDSAFGIVPTPADLLSYGTSVVNWSSEARADDALRVCLPDSGYFGYRQSGDSLLIDCGPIGPDYQPGHGHCDTLSYELCIGGRRVIVDSGVHDYELTELRQYVRSTAAHNTVRIDGMEQSEIWGAFRVARRAYPIDAEISGWKDGCLEFRGSHDGYCRLPGKPVHERQVRIETVGRWMFSDMVTGGGEHLVESFVHLHPDFELDAESDTSFLIRDGESAVARLRLESDCEASVVTGSYCPEFGRREDNSVLVLSLRSELPLSIVYSIEKC
jgi:uncharacterized heparinase superfamily protein